MRESRNTDTVCETFANATALVSACIAYSGGDTRAEAYYPSIGIQEVSGLAVHTVLYPPYYTVLYRRSIYALVGKLLWWKLDRESVDPNMGSTVFHVRL